MASRLSQLRPLVGRNGTLAAGTSTGLGRQRPSTRFGWLSGESPVREAQWTIRLYASSTPPYAPQTKAQGSVLTDETAFRRRENLASKALEVILPTPRYQFHTILNLVTDWVGRFNVNIPKGFENFFPKDKKGPVGSRGAAPASKPEDAAGASSKEPPKSSSSSSSSSEKEDSKEKDSAGKKKKKKASGGGGSGNGGGFPDADQNQMIWAAVVLVVVLGLASFLEDDSNVGKEVTWNDFRNYMLEPGDVDRILVINKKVAKVYLRPGARGLPLSRSMMGPNIVASGATSSSSSSATSSGAPSAIRSRRVGSGSSDHATEDDWDDGTSMDMGTTFSSDPRSSGSGSPEDTGVLSSLSRSGRRPNSQPDLVYHFNIGSVEAFEEKLTRAQEELGIAHRDFVPVQYARETNWMIELIRSLPSLITIGITVFLIRRMGGLTGGAGTSGGRGSGSSGGGGGMGGIFQIGRSNAQRVDKEDVEVTFADVAGCDEAKKEIMEFVDFLQDSSRFTKLGAKIPKGALLCGPPGTGKTLLAKAVAGEAEVPFFSISGSDFIEMFVGVGPSRVRDLFKDARQSAPCIIFIDEIDAVGRKRGRGGFSGGNDERENTLNQLLVEMDGFHPSEGVVVLAGTNRVDILDDALTRPGRFDRQITVDKPDIKGRKEIFQVHLRDITVDGDLDDISGRLAGLTPGFAGADIANICNEAAIVAARRKAEAVSMEDFEKATDRIIGGLESNKLISAEERNIVAHHEAGHAVAGWFLQHADPLLKVTIIPRSSGALGYAQYLPKEVFLRTQEQIMDIVCMALAGRAAEEVFFDKVTTGASDDLRRVTDLIYSTIQVYGMNDKIGQLAFPKDPNAGPGEKPYSDAIAEVMDEQAKDTVDAAYHRTVALIREKRAEVQKVAELLLEKETITHDDILDLIGPRPYPGDAAYQEFVQSRRRARDDGNAEEEEEEETNASEATHGENEPQPNAEDEDEDGGGGVVVGPNGLAPGLSYSSTTRV